MAVLHADPEAAALALARMKAQWQLPAAGPDTESIFDHIVSFKPTDQKILGERGDVAAAKAGAAKLFESHATARAMSPTRPSRRIPRWPRYRTAS